MSAASGSSSPSTAGSPGKRGGPSRLTSTYRRAPRFDRSSVRILLRYRFTSSAPMFSSLVAFRSCSFETRHSEPRMFTQAPPAVGNTMTPGPCHFPAPTFGCLQTNTSCPSAKVCGVRCLARRHRSSLPRLSRAAHALVAAWRNSSARLKSSIGFSLRYIGSMRSSDTKEQGRR